MHSGLEVWKNTTLLVCTNNFWFYKKWWTNIPFQFLLEFLRQSVANIWMSSNNWSFQRCSNRRQCSYLFECQCQYFVNVKMWFKYSHLLCWYFQLQLKCVNNSTLVSHTLFQKPWMFLKKIIIQNQLKYVPIFGTFFKFQGPSALSTYYLSNFTIHFTAL